MMEFEATAVDVLMQRVNHTWFNNDELEYAISGCGMKVLSKEIEGEPLRTHLRGTWC